MDVSQIFQRIEDAGLEVVKKGIYYDISFPFGKQKGTYLSISGADMRGGFALCDRWPENPSEPTKATCKPIYVVADTKFKEPTEDELSAIRMSFFFNRKASSMIIYKFPEELLKKEETKYHPSSVHPFFHLLSKKSRHELKKEFIYRESFSTGAPCKSLYEPVRHIPLGDEKLAIATVEKDEIKLIAHDFLDNYDEYRKQLKC